MMGVELSGTGRSASIIGSLIVSGAEIHSCHCIIIGNRTHLLVFGRQIGSKLFRVVWLGGIIALLPPFIHARRDARLTLGVGIL